MTESFNIASPLVSRNQDCSLPQSSSDRSFIPADQGDVIAARFPSGRSWLTMSSVPLLGPQVIKRHSFRRTEQFSPIQIFGPSHDTAVRIQSSREDGS